MRAPRRAHPGGRCWRRCRSSTALGLNVARRARAPAAIALAATLVCSLALVAAPRALGERRRAGMADGGRGSSGHAWRRLGFKLVVLELATAMVLLVGAGLLGKSLYRLLNVDLGFRPDRLATVCSRGARRPLRRARSSSSGSAREVERAGRGAARRRVGRPRQRAARELQRQHRLDPLRRPALQRRAQRGEPARRQRGLPRRRRRAAASPAATSPIDDDATQAAASSIINQALARMYFPGEDPIGQKLRRHHARRRNRSRRSSASSTTSAKARSTRRSGRRVYYPFAQSPDTDFARRRAHGAGGAGVAADARRAQSASGRSAISARIRRGHDRATGSRTSPAAYLQRSSAWLVGGFAGARAGARHRRALRRHRLLGEPADARDWRAHGARRRPRRGVSADSARSRRPAAVGIVVGLAGAVAAATFMRKLLFDTPPRIDASARPGGRWPE